MSTPPGRAIRVLGSRAGSKILMVKSLSLQQVEYLYRLCVLHLPRSISMIGAGTDALFV
jgi:hypothetical protein